MILRTHLYEEKKIVFRTELQFNAFAETISMIFFFFASKMILFWKNYLMNNTKHKIV